MRTSIKNIRAMKITLVMRTLFACLVVVALSLAAIPSRAGDAEDKAKQALEALKAAKQDVVDKKAALEKAEAIRNGLMKDDFESGKNKKKKKTPEEEKALENARAEVAKAQAALEKAEVALVLARYALEQAINGLPDGDLKKELERERVPPPSPVTGNGLHTVKFDTPSGQLVVKLPDDMMAGDTISGTVTSEPKGSTDEERNRNSGVLNGYVVQIEGQNFPVNKGSVGPMVLRPLRRPTGPGIPPALDSFFDVFVAVDLSSSPLGRVRIPLLPSGAVITPDPKITPSFIIPPLGQTGRPIVITGPFDGNASNTTLNGAALRTSVQDFEKNTENVSGGFGLLAESPRKAVFRSPENVVGPIKITLKEGITQTTGTYRNVGVDLTAPKTSLLKGESTELRVQVNGLEGIKTPIPLTLECKGVITMMGGNYQALTIQPSQVGADGSYSTTRGITGVQAGGWAATATVVTGPFNVCLQDDSRAATVILWNTVSGDYSFRPPGGSSAPPAGGAPLTGKGKMVMKGCILTLQHNAPDRRVMSRLDTCKKTGDASVETTTPNTKFTIRDRNTTDNACGVQ